MHHGERINSISHLIGTSLAAAGLVVLVVHAARLGDPWKIVSFSIYGVTLVALYLFSTLFHSTRGTIKLVFQTLDHAAIYLLIAGTYTPITLVTLRGVWGWWLFGVIWGLAFIGMMQDLLARRRRSVLSVVIYLLMGWLIVVAIRPLAKLLPAAGMAWIIAGGLAYTVGVVFYALDKRIAYGHEIFHFLVLTGSACHYVTILFYIA
jgi:hemolysin III